MTNTGYFNAGYGNTGDYNTADYNTGHRNAGYCNIGNQNAGHYNAGDYNAGNGNTGRYNTGKYNIGYCNTGNCNTGNCNTGYHNTGDFHTGWFNTLPAEGGYYFNKWLTHEEWNKAEKPKFILEFHPTRWIYSDDMTDQEKEENPGHKPIFGYPKKISMKEAWAKAWAEATEEDKALLLKLPNFDAEVFLEITGIDVRSARDGEEIVIDGVTYALKAKG